MISLRTTFLSRLGCGVASLMAATAAFADGPKRTYDAYGHVGYQHQWGPVVLGAEFGYSPLHSSKSFDSVTSTGLTLGMRANDLFTYTGKLGYAHERFLGYVRGGWATTNIGASTDGTLVASSSDRATGWVAGLGLDYALTQRVILGAEYNNVRFNGREYSFTDGTTTANATASGLDIQSVKLRLDFKFN